MNYRDYITIEPNKRGGKPCVRGLRITVYSESASRLLTGKGLKGRGSQLLGRLIEWKLFRLVFVIK